MQKVENKNNGIALISIITILFTGINGLITYIFLTLLSSVEFGRDPEIKHGIAKGSSRLGGLVILCSVVFGVLFNLHFFSKLSFINVTQEFDSIILFSILVGLIGLAEDFTQKLSSTIRLKIMFLFVLLALIAMPQLVPNDLPMFNIDGFVIHQIFVFLVTLVLICGFINAGNIADGANGLLAGTYLSFFIILYSFDSSVFNFSMLTTLTAFIIYNASTGRIFLGDFGSYLLSTIVAFKSLEIYLLFDVPVFFLASILIYPCFELIRSLLNRLANKNSLMSPDNYHLHNYVNSYLLRFKFSKHMANSMTGLGIAVISSVPLILYFNDIVSTWLYFFMFEFFLLCLFYLLLGKINLKKI